MKDDRKREYFGYIMSMAQTSMCTEFMIRGRYLEIFQGIGDICLKTEAHKFKRKIWLFVLVFVCMQVTHQYARLEKLPFQTYVPVT